MPGGEKDKYLLTAIFLSLFHFSNESYADNCQLVL
jgi:hypothetical protein